MLGDRVIVHPGCHIGQDGFGYVPTKEEQIKVPQIGRVILQDDVEIGAGTKVDRGGIRDTVIGAGTKIDNWCQIGHNVVIGKNCIIVAQSGLSGSVTLEDNVVLAARVGIIPHVTVGKAARCWRPAPRCSGTFRRASTGAASPMPSRSRSFSAKWWCWNGSPPPRPRRSCPPRSISNNRDAPKDSKPEASSLISPRAR